MASLGIPGLGTLPTVPPKPTIRKTSLAALSELRIHVPQTAPKPLTVRLASGTAEHNGVELAPNLDYQFRGPLKTKIMTWTGCDLEVSGGIGEVGEEVVSFSDPEQQAAVQFLNLHFALQKQREDAVKLGRDGPRVMIVGERASGKTSMAKMLTAWAVKTGHSPVAINVSPSEGMLSLPGTVSASVMGTNLDVEAGWGGTPTSGPSTWPVKLPIVYYYGQERVEEDVPGYMQVVGKLAAAVSARSVQSHEVRGSGMIIDSPDFDVNNERAWEGIGHVVEEFSVNMIVILGSLLMASHFQSRFSTQRTSLNEPINILPLSMSSGVLDRDEGFLQLSREAAIREYFFGEPRRGKLDPMTQTIEFDELSIYRMQGLGLQLVTEPLPELTHWCLAIMHAAPRDTPENIRFASVMGFVYVADIDQERRKVKLLTPINERVTKPLVWGGWPDAVIGLVG